MPYPIRPAYVEGSGTPIVRHYVRGSGTAWTVIGAPVGISSGVIDEHAGASTVTGILGFAMALPATAPGYNMANANLIATGTIANRADEVPVAIASRAYCKYNAQQGSTLFLLIARILNHFHKDSLWYFNAVFVKLSAMFLALLLLLQELVFTRDIASIQVASNIFAHCRERF